MWHIVQKTCKNRIFVNPLTLNRLRKIAISGGRKPSEIWVKSGGDFIQISRWNGQFLRQNS